MIRTKAIKEKLKKYNTELSEAFIRYADESFLRAVKNATPTTPPPVEGKLLDKQAEEQYLAVLTRQKDDVRQTINKALEAIDKALVKAPSQDAVNYLSMLALRENVTPEEIDSALKQYGDNYASFKAICDIAKKHKVYCTEVYLVAEVKRDLEAQLRDFERRGVFNGESFSNSGYVAFLNSVIDGILEVEIEE